MSRTDEESDVSENDSVDASDVNDKDEEGVVEVDN